MSQLSLDEITNRIVDAILADNVFKRDQLTPKIRAILKIWMTVAERPVNWDKAKTPVGKLRETIHKKDFECIYWRNKIKNIINDDRVMKAYYANLDKELNEAGLN